MTGSSELNVKAGDWVVLRNGEVRGPVDVDEDKNGLFPIGIRGDDSVYYMSWTAEGWENVDPEHIPDTDIVAVLPCPPLERIRQLEDALRDLIKDLNMRGKPSINGKGRVLDVSDGVLQTARKALEASQ